MWRVCVVANEHDMWSLSLLGSAVVEVCMSYGVCMRFLECVCVCVSLWSVSAVSPPLNSDSWTRTAIGSRDRESIPGLLLSTDLYCSQPLWGNRMNYRINYFFMQFAMCNRFVMSYYAIVILPFLYLSLLDVIWYLMLRMELAFYCVHLIFPSF